MKKKNSMVTLVVLVAILVLGVGYAVVTGVDLNISGNVAAKSENLKVKFTAANPSTKTNGVVGAITSDLVATIEVEDLELGTPKTVTYTIQNYETDINALITQTSAGVATNTTFYEVTTDLGSGKTVNASGTLDVTVTVTLVKTPITEAQSKDVATIVLHAEPQAQA